MHVKPTTIPDVKIIVPKVYRDERGCLLETWNRNDFARAGLDLEFVQDNLTNSVRGTIRGLHYQIRHSQGKLIRVVHGEIFDVAVDLRRSSPSFARWVGIVLSAQSQKAVWIPPGFAHGFQVLSERADVQYKCTDSYSPEHERTILWNDPDLAIEWPGAADRSPLLSPRDRQGVAFREADYFP